MTQQPGRKRTLKTILATILRDERGVAAVVLTVFLPMIVGLFTFATDMGYVMWTRNQLQVAAEAGALAATSNLPDTSVCSSSTSACFKAKKYVELNMPAAKFGTVLVDADVEVGTWIDGCPGGGLTCFTKVAAGTSCTAAQCNAVRVTTRQAAQNGNALKLVFAPMIGMGNFDVSATAIAAYGLGQSGAQPTWNVIVAQDITQSLSQADLTKMKQADRALLDCMYKYAASGSKYGVTLFTGCSGASCIPPLSDYQQPISITPTNNYNFMKTKVGDPPTTVNNGIKLCGTTNSAGVAMPPCSNGATNVSTDQKSGMAAAYTQFCPSTPCSFPNDPVGSRHAIIVVSDGLPQQLGGTSCGGSGQTQRCDGTNGTPNLEGDGLNMANAIAAQGVDIYTIYYGSDTRGRDYMAKLSRTACVSGATCTPNLSDPTKAFDTPLASELDQKMQAICSQMPHRLVW